MKRKIWLLKNLEVSCLKSQVTLPSCCDYTVLKCNFPEYSCMPYETHDAGTGRQRCCHQHSGVRGPEWVEVWILLFPVESTSPTFIQAPAPSWVWNNYLLTAAGVQHMETEETFEVLFCPVKQVSKNKRRKTQDCLWIVWMMVSQGEMQKRLDRGLPQAAYRMCLWPLCLFYSLPLVKESMLVKEIPSFSLISGVSISPYRLLSSAGCNIKLMQWGQCLRKWYLWEQEERWKSHACGIVCARQSWERLPNSWDFIFRLHGKMLSIQLQHFHSKSFTMKASIIEITNKIKSDVPGWKTGHLYEVLPSFYK